MKKINLSKLGKIITIALALVVITALLAACGGEGAASDTGAANDPVTTPDTPAVTNDDNATNNANASNGSVFAGLNPQRVFVLDHTALDVIYTLGFGDRVVGVLGGRSASDAPHLEHFVMDAPGVRVLDMHLGGIGATVTASGGGIFANAANTRIVGSTVFGNRSGDLVCDITHARPNLDGGNNHLGVVLSFDEAEPFVLHNTSQLNAEDAALVAQLQAITVPSLVQTPGTGETTWAAFTAAVANAAPGDIVRVGANLTMNSRLIIDQDIVIYGNGFTLTRAENLAGAPIIIYGGYDVNVTMQNIVFDGNNVSLAVHYATPATAYDGGIIRSFGNLTIAGAVFKNGNSQMITGGVGVGGAISSSTPAESDPVTLAIFDSFFYNNFAGRQGGAIRSTGILYVENTYFINNTETRSGGGAISASGPTTIVGSTFFGNIAAFGDVLSNSMGGAIHFTGANPMEIENSTIVGNTSGAIPTVDGDGATTNIEVFLTIDADLIVIGPALEHLYETVFSLIAPTMVINAPAEHQGGLLAGVFQAARTIAPLWNVEEAAEALIAELTTRFGTVSAVVGQRSGIAVALNAGAAATVSDGGFLVASEEAFASSLLAVMGFSHYNRNAIPEHFASTDDMSNYAADLIATAYLAGNEIEMTLQDVMDMFIEWVDSNPNINYVIVFSNEFASINEAVNGQTVRNAAGDVTFAPDYTAVLAMQTYAGGRLAFFSNTSNTNGLGRIAAQLDALEAIFD